MTKKATDGKESYKENFEERENNYIPEASALPEGTFSEWELVQDVPAKEESSSVSRIAELEIELNKQKEQADKYRDELLRKAADFENFRKQKEREAMMSSSRTLENIIREILPVVDDVKRVLQHAPLNSETSGEARLYIEGVELVKKNLEKWLDQKGVTAIESKGMKLDVNFHEAISQIDQPEVESDTIIDEYQTGYLLGDKVIRHAKVIVAR
ncbi:MAG: nucleotide exchange factor GrpE [Chlorobiaceae bacterium]|nr:nucleotide exchange factor GrpE [Chlorobiaceae bacterium]